MGTPFISLLEPSRLDGYNPSLPREDQPSHIPATFLDAMEVRNAVFVQEQGVNVEYEFDDDDPRCCHWVAYASVHTTDEEEVRDETGTIVQPRRSSTRSMPIATLRLVPFPHSPHPVPGGKYWNNVLNGDKEKPRVQSRDLTVPVYAQDRATTYHDGRESYVKIGRLAVRDGFRRHKMAGVLVNTAIQWLKDNPSYFDPSITELGLEQIGARRETDIPSWVGLICVHAQKDVQYVWERFGFKVDDGMGSWWEEGILHVGMFQRLNITEKKMRIY